MVWDRKRIAVRNRLDLTRLLAVPVSAVLGAIGGFMTGLNYDSALLRAGGIHWLSCPPRPAAGANQQQPNQPSTHPTDSR